MPEIEIKLDSIELVRMSDQDYFSSKYKEYISNSRLGFLNEDEDGSIEKFLSGFKEEYSDSFALGTAVHNLMLQPDDYYISKCDKPTAKLGEFAEKVFNLRKEGLKLKEAINIASDQANYYSGKLSETRLKTAIKGSIKYYVQRMHLKEEVENKSPLFLSKPMKEKLDSCIAGISANKNFLNKLRPKGLLEPITSLNEYAIFAEFIVRFEKEEKIVKVKGKLDNFTIDNETQTITLNDLKTTGRNVKFFMGNKVKEIDEAGNEVWRWYPGSMEKYHYYRQLALYSLLLKAALKQYYDIDYTIKVNMLVVETIPNFTSIVYPVNNKFIQRGLQEFKRLLVKVAENDLHKKL